MIFTRKDEFNLRSMSAHGGCYWILVKAVSDSVKICGGLSHKDNGVGVKVRQCSNLLSVN